MANGSTLQLGLANGEMLRLLVPPERDHEFLDAAANALPHTSVGFSPELQTQFSKQPASLRRS